MTHTTKRLIPAIICIASLAYGCNEPKPTPVADKPAEAPKEALVQKDNCDPLCLNQSPVNIDLKYVQTAAMLKPIDVHAAEATMQVVKNSHGDHDNIQVNADPADAANYLMLNDVKYPFVQFHFHYTSEHAVANSHDSMEMHIVYQNKETQARVVVGVMMMPDRPNPFIANVWEHFKKQPTSIKINLGEVLNTNTLSGYYTYTGSLTTPGYEEGATWFVLKGKMGFTLAQLAEFKAMHIGEARPLQPINNRLIFTTSK